MTCRRLIGVVCATLLVISRQHGHLVNGLPSPEAHRKLAINGGPEYTYRVTSDHVAPFGPSEWADGYPYCNGSSQSPINLSAAEEESVSLDIEFYPETCDSAQLSFSALDHFFKVSFDGCDTVPSLRFQGKFYEVLQMHVHSASEHTIGSTHHDAEIHIVHVREGTVDELLVVGVLMDASGHGDNEEIEALWDVLRLGAQNATEAGKEFTTSVYDLLPATPSFVHYMGSLTTPPCTEGVTWIVMTEPTLMSELQLQEYRYTVALLDRSKVNELGNTNRPTQPLNERRVMYCA